MISIYKAKTMVEKFNSLEDQYKELLFRASSTTPAYINRFIYYYNFENFDKCESPIEVLFYIAFEIINHYAGSSQEYNEKGKYIIQPQVDILEYRVDFLIHGKNKKIVVEADGHEYHSTKEQIAKDNKRQNDLTLAGYTVMRFSGSQLSKNAMAEAGNVWKACAL